MANIPLYQFGFNSDGSLLFVVEMLVRGIPRYLIAEQRANFFQTESFGLREEKEDNRCAANGNNMKTR